MDADKLIEAMARGMCAADPDVRMGDAEGVVQQRVNLEWRYYIPQATAAYTAMRDALVPVGWLYTSPEGTVRKSTKERWDHGRPDYWAETPLFALPEVKP